MKIPEQIEKAERFLALHREDRILVLPNVWDPIGALLMQDLGFHAVATASAALSWSLARDDGESVPFDRVVDLVAVIAGAVDLPVSADIEAGFAPTAEGVAQNVKRILRAGAVGINLEDSIPSDGSMRKVGDQCDRIRAARAAAREEGCPLVINARIDTCAADPGRQREMLDEMIARGKAYREAGADCLYPIMVDDLDVLKGIGKGTGLPVNVYAQASLPSIAAIEAAGVRRLSLGPGLLRASLTAMREAAEGILGGSVRAVTSDAMTSDDVRRLLATRRGEEG